MKNGQIFQTPVESSIRGNTPPMGSTPPRTGMGLPPPVMGPLPLNYPQMRSIPGLTPGMGLTTPIAGVMPLKGAQIPPMPPMMMGIGLRPIDMMLSPFNM